MHLVKNAVIYFFICTHDIFYIIHCICYSIILFCNNRSVPKIDMTFDRCIYKLYVRYCLCIMMLLNDF